MLLRFGPFNAMMHPINQKGERFAYKEPCLCHISSPENVYATFKAQGQA